MSIFFASKTNAQLASLIARAYDDGKDYRGAWRELVYRVGVREAERMVDHA